MNVEKDSQFVIDFFEFAPSGHPTTAGEQAPKPVPVLGGQGEGGIRRRPLVKTVKNRNQTALMGSFIGYQGYVRFFVRIETPGVISSTCAVVDYGEPQPETQAATSLEALTRVIKMEGDPTTYEWGTELDAHDSGHPSYRFRWTTQCSCASARWQLSDLPFPENPVLYKDPNFNHVWGDITEVATPSIPVGQPVEYNAEIGQYLVPPGEEDRTYYVRLIPLKSDGTLAGQPSNTVKLTVHPLPIPVATPESTYLTFTTELVGYRSPGFGPTDPYRFVLTRAPTSDLAQWQKLTGHQNPQAGDQVYLPPEQPADAKAWYEQVYDALKWCLGKLQDLSEGLATLKMVLEQVFIGYPTMLANYLAGELYIDKALAATSIDKAMAVAGYVDQKVFAAAHMAMAADYYAATVLDGAGVPAAEWINLRGKVAGAMYQCAHQASTELVTDKMLVPDEQAIEHPAFAFLKVTAVQKGDKSVKLVSPAGSYHLRANGWHSDPQSPDANKGWQHMFTKNVSLPSMCDGMSMVVPVVLDYDPAYYKSPKQWMVRYNQTTAMRWLLDFDELSVKQGTASWGG